MSHTDLRIAFREDPHSSSELYHFQDHGSAQGVINDRTRKYMHAETLALLTKPLYFPNMKYLKLLSW
jgi:hypothetical protein